jgi:hypothetical protein
LRPPAFAEAGHAMEGSQPEAFRVTRDWLRERAREV